MWAVSDASSTTLGLLLEIHGEVEKFGYPPSAALGHPAFSDLCKAERDFILSTRGKNTDLYLIE